MIPSLSTIAMLVEIKEERKLKKTNHHLNYWLLWILSMLFLIQTMLNLTWWTLIKHRKTWTNQEYSSLDNIMFTSLSTSQFPKLDQYQPPNTQNSWTRNSKLKHGHRRRKNLTITQPTNSIKTKKSPCFDCMLCNSRRIRITYPEKHSWTVFRLP